MNIFNETCFRKKLFALIAYKNIHPYDFSELIYDWGKMHLIFDVNLCGIVYTFIDKIFCTEKEVNNSI